MSTVPRRRAGVPLWFVRAGRGVFAIAAVLHAGLAVAQPVLAGWSLDGDGNALELHGVNGALVLTMSMVLVPLSILWWRPGRGTGWAPLLAVALVTAETFQIAAGYADVLVVHVPLGITVLLGSLFLAGLSLRTRRLGPTSAQRQNEPVHIPYREFCP